MSKAAPKTSVYGNKYLLDISGLDKSYGGIKALHEISFGIKENSIVSIIGPNGAGKTTFINVATGMDAPDKGRVLFQGEDISDLPAYEIAYRGLGRTFQLEELFQGMTVIENVMVGRHTKSRSGLLKVGFNLPSAKREEEQIREKAFETLKMVGLENRALQLVSTLPLGERKLLGVARTLSMDPGLIMLDEPVGGLAAHEANRLTDMIYSLMDKGITFIIVEHNMPFVMNISQNIIVFNYGEKIAEGMPEDIRKNEDVIKAYLGEDY